MCNRNRYCTDCLQIGGKLCLHMLIRGPNIALDHEALGLRLIAEVDRCSRYYRSLSLIRFDYHGLPVGQSNGEPVDAVAAILRPSDTVAKLGDSRYCVLAPESPVEVGRLIAERIWRWAQERPVSGREGADPAMALSFGIAGFEGRHDSALDIYARAGSALSYAVGQGGNRIAIMMRGGLMSVCGLTPTT